MANYNKLWKLLIDKNLNKSKLAKLTGLSTSTISKLVRGEDVHTSVLCRICDALDCDFGDIMTYVNPVKSEENI